MAIRQKITAADIFKCGDIGRFASTIVQILDYRGVSLSNFYLCELEGVRFLTKLSFYLKSMPEIYRKEPLADSLTTTVDTEVKSLQLLRDNIIAKGVSPGIVELIYYAKCEEMVVPGKESPLYAHFNNIAEDQKKLIAGGLADRGLVFMVLERCDITIEHFCQQTHDNPISVAVVRSLIFQIVYTLNAIKKLYPGFRHNDLHSSNVMLRVDTLFVYSPMRPKYMRYEVDGAVYFVPYFGIIAKIIDFAFAQFPTEGIVSSFTADPIGMYSRDQDDLLLLLNDLATSTVGSVKDVFVSIAKMMTTSADYGAILGSYSDYQMAVEPVANSIFGRYK